ncbi:TPA: hypothetical protein ACL9AN_001567 [Streptococcus pneumoniae]
MLQLKLVKQEIEAEKPASEIEAEKPASVEAWIISVKLKKVATDIYRFQKQKR